MLHSLKERYHSTRLPITKKLSTKFLLFCLDMLGAAIFSLLTYALYPLDFVGESLTIWVVSLGLFWFVTLESQRYFVLDSYSRVVRLVFWSFFATLIYVLTLRSGYSLKAFVLTMGAWMLWAFWVRFQLRKNASPVKILTNHLTAQHIQTHPRIKLLTVEHPDDVKLGDYDYVAIDPYATYSKDWGHFFVHAQVVGTPVFTLSELDEYLYGRIGTEYLRENWVGNSFTHNTPYIKLKRLIDITGILLATPLVVPICGLIALAIRWRMGKGVLFKQTRVGQDEKLFTVYKFRSMEHATQLENEQHEAHRITPLGTFLRRHRLDELPQLWNVLKGDMSLIGPRPEALPYVEAYAKKIPLFNLRHVVKPGISGWAQTNQGHTSTAEQYDEKIRYDIFYIKHFSFWLDMKILSKTLYILLTGKGAK
jgi:lipopolysaccharide/colanic/teichoic acid biosynthesis glycosyltransferase